mmetsp:Transcript_43610/g.123384  ORF Transcript_43610/g.123384 Transcript_43610/m.123384 type:complete len:258 (+) Transcript_43610:928-1701(+)
MRGSTVRGAPRFAAAVVKGRGSGWLDCSSPNRPAPAVAAPLAIPEGFALAVAVPEELRGQRLSTPWALGVARRAISHVLPTIRRAERPPQLLQPRAVHGARSPAFRLGRHGAVARTRRGRLNARRRCHRRRAVVRSQLHDSRFKERCTTRSVCACAWSLLVVLGPRYCSEHLGDLGSGGGPAGAHRSKCRHDVPPRVGLRVGTLHQVPHIAAANLRTGDSSKGGSGAAGPRPVGFRGGGSGGIAPSKVICSHRGRKL